MAEGAVDDIRDVLHSLQYRRHPAWCQGAELQSRVAGGPPGEAFPTGPDLLAASGAAFAAVLIGQAGNAFACRSATRPPGRLGWFTNRLLVIAIVVQLLALAAFLLVEPLAELLEHRPPPPAALARCRRGRCRWCRC